jgi:protein-disulfide isomerase
MKSRLLLACTMTIAAMGAAPAYAANAPAKAAHAKDWTTVVSPTAAGGFVMGNPKAKVKLIEYGSMTCPHCARFDESGVPSLVSKYVKSGQVSYEFRNYVRDALDVTAALLARCNGAKSFFPVTRALFKEQEAWEKKVDEMPGDQLKAWDDLPNDQKFLTVAKGLGLQQLAAQHGVPEAKSAVCLASETNVDQLVKMTNDATTEFPDFVGTPSFVINGKLVDLGQTTEGGVWGALESRIKDALGGQG